MLAYVFWHRPREGVDVEVYEQAQIVFQRSLEHSPPFGFLGSVCFRAAELPWLGGATDGYESWFLVEDFTALGVINEAAVGRGHRTAHDKAAHSFRAGAGGLYALIEGHEPQLERASVAVWIEHTLGVDHSGLSDLLFGDGMDPGHASLWRRQLVFGPAPEFCLLTTEASAGIAATRLPAGWRAKVSPREARW